MTGKIQAVKFIQTSAFKKYANENPVVKGGLRYLKKVDIKQDLKPIVLGIVDGKPSAMLSREFVVLDKLPIKKKIASVANEVFHAASKLNRLFRA